jgi:hypothetical protein
LGGVRLRGRNEQARCRGDETQPEVGEFAMADLEPFPELIEARRLDPNRVNGVDQALLTIGAERDAVVTFRDEVAALQNVLGVYLIDPDGTIRDPEIVFARIEHADPLPGLPGVRPGGGPLEPGDSVALSTLYPAADLPGATEGSTTVGGVDFNTFTVGAAELLVQTGVDTSGTDTAVA